MSIKVEFTEDELLFLKDFINKSVSNICIFDSRNKDIPKAREIVRKLVLAHAFPKEG